MNAHLISSKRGRRVLSGAFGLLLVVALIVGLVASVWALPGFPHRFLGQVTVNGEPAPEGLTVSAQINGITYETGATDSLGRYGRDNADLFQVPFDDPDVPGKEGGVNGEAVNFLVNGVPCGNAVFQSGNITELNLDVVLLEYVLTAASSEGGTVTDPGEGNFTYFQGTVVDLLAVPDQDFEFVDWTGDVGTVADTNSANTTITMDGNYVIQANFAEVLPQRSLTTSKSDNEQYRRRVCE